MKRRVVSSNFITVLIIFRNIWVDLVRFVSLSTVPAGSIRKILLPTPFDYFSLIFALNFTMTNPRIR